MNEVHKSELSYVKDEIVDYHHQVLLAHAQEQLLYKAIKDKRKNNLLARLAQSVRSI